jgi:hypothetical protein
MRANLRALTVLTAAAVVIAGCSDSSTGPSSSAVPDVASLLAETSPSSLNNLAAIAAPRLASTVATAAVDPTKCPYSADTGFFVCAAVTTNGLTFTRMFRLMDAAGNPQSKPDVQTSAFETKTTVDGTITSNHITGASDQTLSGIQSDTHTLNGTSTMSITGQTQIGSVVVPLDETQKETTANLVLPNTKTGQKWPQSGTITIESTSGLSSLADGATRMQIVFNGTSTVTITMTSYFGTTSCQVDLTNPSFNSCLG